MKQSLINELKLIQSETGELLDGVDYELELETEDHPIPMTQVYENNAKLKAKACQIYDWLCMRQIRVYDECRKEKMVK